MLNVTDTMPNQIKRTLNLMSSIEFQSIKFLLSRLNAAFVSEWMPIYIAIADYVYTLYQLRKATDLIM